VDFVNSTPDAPPGVTSVKIIVGGGLGGGKTTFLGAMSEIVPLSMEAEVAPLDAEADDLLAPSRRTVTINFGRISLDRELILYLFAMPGRDPISFVWDDLVKGAIGGVVLVDPGRIADSFATLDYFEETATPFVVGVGGDLFATVEDIRDALTIGPQVPIVSCDARSRESAKAALITLVTLAGDLCMYGEPTSVMPATMSAAWQG
jgi:signal recognition particle receptor subunit beta